MGLIAWLTDVRRSWNGRRKNESPDAERTRLCHFEDMEPRYMLNAAPISLGATYLETDSGGDHHGDIFEIMYQGGAAGTQLTHLEINGDHGPAGLSFGDMIFDTAPGGLGADGSFGFQVVSASGIDSVKATVEDGSSKLILDFTGFDAGEKLVFSIDVDEVQDYDPVETNLAIINEGIDPIASGVEFQGSALQATFAAPHYFDVSNVSDFRNAYDSRFVGTNLLRSESNPNGLPNDDYQNEHDRSAGGIVALQQQPKPISISGRVFLDNNLDLTQQAEETGIAGVQLSLWKQTGEGYVDTGLSTTTDSEGNYRFGRELGLLPGKYQIREAQPADLLSVGAIPGQVAGTNSGSIVASDPNILTEIEIPFGDTDALRYDFAEAQMAQVCGYVYVDTNNDGVFDAAEHGIAGVTLLVTPIDSLTAQSAITVETDAAGYYCVKNLSPGTYRITETQPLGYFDGQDRAGTIRGASVGSAKNPGDEISGVRLRGGDQSIDNNFGELVPGSIAGKVYSDLDGDCLFTPGDSPLAGVTVWLFDSSGNLLATTLTDDAGQYRFVNLPPGNYTVREEQPLNYFQGGQMAGSGGGDASVDDIISAINIGSGQNLTDYDFCEIPPATLSGYVFVDPNLNQLFDPREQPIVGVRVELVSTSGAVAATTTTDANGHYLFTQLHPGTYTVREQQPAGYYHEGQIAGSNSGDASVDDIISNIRIGAGKDLTDYNFCELLPSRLSGYVFRDGPAIATTDGLPPQDLSAIRNGQLTPDDQRLAGVVLELRNALTGEAITADDVLPGIYPPGALRAVTDVNGYYEFHGLSQGSYAVIQIQPSGYYDGIDTAGTSGGVAINPSTQVDQQVIQPFTEAGVKLNNDAILRIPIGFGFDSQANNFSEIQVDKLSPPPKFPFFIERPLTLLPTPPAPTFVAPPTIPIVPVIPLPLAKVEDAPQGGDGDFAWHLSVVNGGSPRGNTRSFRIDKAHTLRAAKVLELTQWKAEHLRAGRWLVPTAQAGVSETSAEFGIEGGIPLTGDFNGDGSSELALFMDGEWFIDINNNGTWDDADLWAKLGNKGDLPVVGDWDGDGKDDIGIYGLQWARDPVAVFHEPGLPDVENLHQHKLKNVPPQPYEATNGARHLQATATGERTGDLIDHVFFLGSGTDLPITGDFNGDGIDTIGVFSAGLWRIDINGDGKFTSHDRSIQFGEARDIPIVGDFDGDGIDEIGVFRAGKWIIDSNHNGEIDAADKVFELGESGDQPVVGDFNGDGIDEPGIYRNHKVAHTARVVKP